MTQEEFDKIEGHLTNVKAGLDMAVRISDLNKELIIALAKCRQVLDDIWFEDPADKEDHALWAADQREAIEMADAVLAKVRNQ